MDNLSDIHWKLSYCNALTDIDFFNIKWFISIVFFLALVMNKITTRISLACVKLPLKIKRLSILFVLPKKRMD